MSGDRDSAPPELGSGWEGAFVATSLAIGESLEDVERAIGAEALARAGAWASRLRGAKRGARANALALALAPVAQAIEEMELR